MGKIIETSDTKLKIYTMEEFDKIILEKRIKDRNDASDSNNYLKSLTYNLQEAEELRKNGDQERYDKIIHFVNEFVTYTKFNKKMSRNKEDVVGFAPNVAATLMGTPKKMFNQETKMLPSKELTIAFSPSFSSKYSPDEIITFGTVILSLIDKLENENIKVNFNMVFNFGVEAEVVKAEKIKTRKYFNVITQLKASCFDFGRLLNITNKNIPRYIDEEKIIYKTITPDDENDFYTEGFVLPLKNIDEPLSIYNIAYYIANPSFLRRHCLKVVETDSFFSDTTYNGYGAASLKSAASAEQAIKKKFKNVAFFSVWNSDFTDSSKIGQYINEAYIKLKKEFPSLFESKQNKKW